MSSRFAPIAALALLAGCAHVRARDEGWIRVEGVPVVRQVDEKDCGDAALAMVFARWNVSRADAPDEARAGDLKELAIARGLHAFVLEGTVEDLEEHLGKGRPVVVGLVRRNGLTHYEVVVALHPARRLVVTHDPAAGVRRRSLHAFLAEWVPSGRVTLLVFPRE